MKTLDPAIGPEALFGNELWQGDLYYLFAITIVIFLSGLTFKYIETPARSRFRSFINSKYSHKTQSQP